MNVLDETSELLIRGPRLSEAEGAVILLHGRNAPAESIVGVYEEIAVGTLHVIAPRAPGRSWYPHSFFEPDRDEPTPARPCVGANRFDRRPPGKGGGSATCHRLFRIFTGRMSYPGVLCETRRPFRGDTSALRGTYRIRGNAARLYGLLRGNAGISRLGRPRSARSIFTGSGKFRGIREDGRAG